MLSVLFFLLYATPPALSGTVVESPQRPPHVRGRLSMYRPGDGFNAGQLACGGTFTEQQEHVAIRNWHRVGCGCPVRVCAQNTGVCRWTKVRDAGPFGIYTGPLRHAVREGRWKVWTGRVPPKGWKWRAVVDLSYGLWRSLGRPAPLSEVSLTYGKGCQDSQVANIVPARNLSPDANSEFLQLLLDLTQVSSLASAMLLCVFEPVGDIS